MDRPEIERAYERLGAIIFRRCVALLRDVEEARDATQEAFVRLVRCAGRLDDPEHTLPWLYRVSTNVCLSRLRVRRRLQYMAPDALPEAIDPVGFEQRLILHEQLERVLAGLDERGQQVFVYAFVDDLGQDEIARVMGLSRRTVGKKIKRVRELLAGARGAREVIDETA